MNSEGTISATANQKASDVVLMNLPKLFPADSNAPDESSELDHQIRAELMAHCYSFLNEDDEARQCVQKVWKKYLKSVGDAGTLAAFFDTLPFQVKKAVLPKYQYEIMEWCSNLFHVRPNALLCSIYYSETFQRVIRFAMKSSRSLRSSKLTAIIYISMDFDPNLIEDLTSSLANIKFEHIRNDPLHEDMIDIEQLDEFIQRDMRDALSYPFMVIANAGTSLLGRCDDLSKIKSICEKQDLWLHVIGDFLGSIPLLSKAPDTVNISCDSFTLDIIKLFGIQNLPYLTFFLRSAPEQTQKTSSEKSDDPYTLVQSHPLYDYILHSPSISFLTVWSISQRCSDTDILYHMKHSFELSNLFLECLKSIETIRLVNDDDQKVPSTYQRLSADDLSNESLPKSVVVFRFEPEETFNLDNSHQYNMYVDLLNLWLFDRLCHEHPKLNFELLKSAHFQKVRSDEDRTAVHAIRFAPLEHVLDIIERDEMKGFFLDLNRYSSIILATLKGRLNLSSTVSDHRQLLLVPIDNWAGVGAIRYVPNDVDREKLSQMDEMTMYQIDSIQLELARKLQSKDSAFSLGGVTDDTDTMHYLRLGMIKKAEDLNILLHKVCMAGLEVEASLKYVEAMAEKIKLGIEKVQKDLHDENLQLLAQGGLLRQLPLVSNIMSWWSPSPSNSSSATKGRSYDLTTGSIESTEDTYIHRMQIKKQIPTATTHNDHEISSNSDTEKLNDLEEQKADK